MACEDLETQPERIECTIASVKMSAGLSSDFICKVTIFRHTVAKMAAHCWHTCLPGSSAMTILAETVHDTPLHLKLVDLFACIFSEKSFVYHTSHPCTEANPAFFWTAARRRGPPISRASGGNAIHEEPNIHDKVGVCTRFLLVR